MQPSLTGQHGVVELVLFLGYPNSPPPLFLLFFFSVPPMFSHCTGVVKHCGPLLFPIFLSTRCYLLVFKMSNFFCMCAKRGHSMTRVDFHFLASVCKHNLYQVSSDQPIAQTFRQLLTFTSRTKDKF